MICIRYQICAHGCWIMFLLLQWILDGRKLSSGGSDGIPVLSIYDILTCSILGVNDCVCKKDINTILIRQQSTFQATLISSSSIGL